MWKLGGMKMSYQIITEATCDYSEAMFKGLPEVKVIPMEVVVEEESYTYGPGGTITLEKFYAMMKEEKQFKTSQITPFMYEEYFEEVLKEGKDIIYLCFSSALSNCYINSVQMVEELKERYPELKIVTIDTLAAANGEALFVREALQKQAEGYSFEQLVQWAEENKLAVCHWFMVDDLDCLKRGGRVSPAVAFIGSAMHIKPILRIDMDGKLDTAEKAHGDKKAMHMLATKAIEGLNPEISKTIFVSGCDAEETCEKVKEMILEQLPDAEVMMGPIGPVIGAHVGLGMCAVVYFGTNR